MMPWAGRAFARPRTDPTSLDPHGATWARPLTCAAARR